MNVFFSIGSNNIQQNYENCTKTRTKGKIRLYSIVLILLLMLIVTQYASFLCLHAQTDYPIHAKVVFLFFQSSDITPESNAFTLMFLYVGVQLFSDARQAQEILEVDSYVLYPRKSHYLFFYLIKYVKTLGVVPLLR